ncbi:MAG: hypothetical protein MHM6MM_002751 [Cercozoa sp. M6MM]
MVSSLERKTFGSRLSLREASSPIVRSRLLRLSDTQRHQLCYELAERGSVSRLRTLLREWKAIARVDSRESVGSRNLSVSGRTRQRSKSDSQVSSLSANRADERHAAVFRDTWMRESCVDSPSISDDSSNEASDDFESCNYFSVAPPDLQRPVGPVREGICMLVYTPLVAACVYGHCGTVAALLDCGADPRCACESWIAMQQQLPPLFAAVIGLNRDLRQVQRVGLTLHKWRRLRQKRPRKLLEAARMCAALMQHGAVQTKDRFDVSLHLVRLVRMNAPIEVLRPLLDALGLSGDADPNSIRGTQHCRNLALLATLGGNTALALDLALHGLDLTLPDLHGVRAVDFAEVGDIFLQLSHETEQVMQAFEFTLPGVRMCDDVRRLVIEYCWAPVPRKLRRLQVPKALARDALFENLCF